MFSLITHHLPLITKVMLAISLMRMGAKKRPFYRVVVKEKRSKRDGKYLENLGTYDPLAEPADVRLNRFWRKDRGDGRHENSWVVSPVVAVLPKYSVYCCH